MKPALAFVSIILLFNSCVAFHSGKKYTKCKNRCYDAYQLAIQPCLNTLENMECKAVYEKDLTNCLQNCQYEETQRIRGKREAQKDFIDGVLYPDKNSSQTVMP